MRKDRETRRFWGWVAETVKDEQEEEEAEEEEESAGAEKHAEEEEADPKAYLIMTLGHGNSQTLVLIGVNTKYRAQVLQVMEHQCGKGPTGKKRTPSTTCLIIMKRLKKMVEKAELPIKDTEFVDEVRKMAQKKRSQLMKS